MGVQAVLEPCDGRASVGRVVLDELSAGSWCDDIIVEISRLEMATLFHPWLRWTCVSFRLCVLRGATPYN